MGPVQTTYRRKQAGLEPWFAGDRVDDYSPADAAVCLAVAYVWLSEAKGCEDRIDAGAIGFERFVGYVLGAADGLPKTPHWAARVSGVPSYTIKALARHWGEQGLPAGVDFAEVVSRAELLGRDATDGPKARPAGLPGTFIGGTVYDYEDEEVLQGARVTVKFEAHDAIAGAGRVGDVELTAVTDGFGTFLVDGPKAGTCRVLIERDGYLPKQWGPVNVGDGLSPRDFAMFADSQGIIWS